MRPRYDHVIAAIIMVAVVACGANQRMSTIHTATTSIDAAHDGFMVWTREHEAALIAKAATRAEAESVIADYAPKRNEVLQGFTVVYRALLLASSKTDEASLQEALKAVGDLYAAIKKLTGGP